MSTQSPTSKLDDTSRPCIIHLDSQSRPITFPPQSLSHPEAVSTPPQPGYKHRPHGARVRGYPKSLYRIGVRSLSNNAVKVVRYTHHSTCRSIVAGGRRQLQLKGNAASAPSERTHATLHRAKVRCCCASTFAPATHFVCAVALLFPRCQISYHIIDTACPPWRGVQGDQSSSIDWLPVLLVPVDDDMLLRAMLTRR